MSRFLAAVAVTASIATACASAPDPGRFDSISEPAAGPMAPAGDAPATNPLPRVEAIDVRTEDRVSLGTLLPAAKPLLVWFWAPHCPYCAREAPGVDAFATRHRDDLSIVGLGTQDTLDLAKGFVDRYGLSDVRMLWDPTFESWRQLGIRGQPAAILLSGDGEQLGSWFGPFDEAEILRLIET